MKRRALLKLAPGMGAIALAMVAATASLAPIQPASAQTRAAIVREVDSPMRGIRYSESVQITFSTGQFLVSQSITPAIPAGKKLYLQSVSTHTLLTDNQSLMEVRLTINPLVAAVMMPLSSLTVVLASWYGHTFARQPRDLPAPRPTGDIAA